MNDSGRGIGATATATPGAAWAPPLVRGPVAHSVPEVSEGRDAATIMALADACRLPGVRVLDVHSDPDHHRSVLTLSGEPLALQDALVALAAECVDRIDLRRHRGAHPRVGALDVAPLVALTPDDIPLAGEIAAGLARRLGDELNLAVFLVGDALASDAARTRPRDFRRDGLERLADDLAEGRLVPDAGPPRAHPTAGVVLVGSRPPLVAWNVALPEGTATEARVIAARVREADGGLPGVRALGLYLTQAATAQVAMNLEDGPRTLPAVAVAAVRREAERLGVRAGDSELVGLISRAALAGASPAALGLTGFRPGQLLEAQLRSLARSN